MKKIILLTAIVMFSVTAFSQEIYPSYPGVPIDDYPYLTQITYYDLNYVSNRITRFLYAKNNMHDLSDKNIYNLKDGVGTITMPYIEMASRGIQSKLMVTYTLFKVDGEFVIKSLKITGDYKKMVLFYVTFWNTEINVEKNHSITNNFSQDLITFNNNIQNPIITVINTTISDTNKFTTDFLNKKKLGQNQTTNSEMTNSNVVEEKNKTIIENKPVKKAAPVIKHEKQIFSVKKRNSTFTFETEIDETLKNKIIEYYSTFQNFNCIVTVTYDIWDDKIKDDSFYYSTKDCK